MDSDDDNVINYGTPLVTDKEDDEIPRKRPVPTEEQTVTDARGLRRFHGAFTGGFSAGYFNTVGTKEGWAPTTFQSSRSSRAGKTGQRPEDFMDEEDLGQFGIAPRAMHVTKNFASEPKAGSSSHKRQREDVGSRNAIPGIPPLKDLIVPASESAGVTILRKMGWKPGQGIGPRVKSRKSKATRVIAKKSGKPGEAVVYGCLPPNLSTSVTSKSGEGDDDTDDEDEEILSGITFAPEDVATFHMSVAKDNYHGIGYSGLDRTPVLSTFSGRRLAAPPVRDAKKKLAITGEAFGVGAYEDEDENIYSVDDMSQYDFELRDKSSLKTKETDSRGRLLTAVSHLGAILEGFCLATKPPPPKIVYRPPPLPRDYRPGRKTVPAAARPDTDRHHRTTMRAADRAAIVGGESSSVMDLLRKEDRVRLDAALSKIRGGVTSSSSSTTAAFKPFGQDADKQLRYELFTKLKEANNEDNFQSCQPRTMTEWERQREIEEFRRASAIYKPLSRDMASRFVSAKLLDTDIVAASTPLVAASSTSPIEPSAVVATVEPAPETKIVTVSREVFEWHPDHILCRRFNIPNPYPDSKLVGVPKVNKEKYSVYNFLTYPTEEETSDLNDSGSGTLKSSTAAPTSESLSSSQKPINLFSCLDEMPPTSMETSSEKTKPTSSQSEAKVDSSDNQRPSMDLFKAIFKDTDSESSSSDSEDEKLGSTADITIVGGRVGTEAVTPSVASIFASSSPAEVVSSSSSRPRPAAFGVFANLDLDSIDVASTTNRSETSTVPAKKLPSVACKTTTAKESLSVGPTRIPEVAETIDHASYGPRLPASFSADRRQQEQMPVLKIPDADSKNWIEKKHHHRSGHKKHKKEKKKKKHKHRNKSPRSADNSSSDSVEEIPLDKKILERLKTLKKHHR